MGDSNAWDLVGETSQEDKKMHERRKHSRSPSYCSRIESDLILNIDESQLQALGLDKEQLAEEAEKEKLDRKRRSKSPALDSLRKVSMTVLTKLGVRKKDVILYRTNDVPEYPLKDFCVKPREYFRTEGEFFSFRTIGRIISPPKEKKPEKCAYLFRGESFEEEMRYEAPNEVERIPEYDPYCPLHGSRRRLRARKIVTMQSIMSSVDQDDQDPTYLYSQELVAKIIRKRKRELLSGEEKIKVMKRIRKIKSNLWILSLAFLFLFTAFHGLQNLQTSINDRLGADSLAVFHFSLALSSLLVPSFMINRLGCKLTVIVAMFIYIVYLLVNLRPTYYSLVPASLLCGVAGSCLWGAKCEYITEMGIKYAKMHIEHPNTVIVRFFGKFFMVVHFGQVIGNQISSSILSSAMKYAEPEDKTYPTCGHAFPKNESFLTEQSAMNLARPPQRAYIAVCLAYIGFASVAVMIVAMFLNALHKDADNRGKAPFFNAFVLKKTFNHFKSLKVMLLVPLTVFNGVEQAFIFGVFTKAFIGCGLGITWIGTVMLVFGVSDAVCSVVFGPLIKLFGRMPLFVFGAVINMIMIVTLMIWPLNPADTMIFYVVACVWGMADGVWNTQVNGFWLALVGRDSLEVAFTNYRFWESLGMSLGFLLVRLVTVKEFLLISFFLLLIGICGYFVIELYDPISIYINRMTAVCFYRQQMESSVDVQLLDSFVSKATANSTRI